ncbi:MAG TPA: hypothetical protein VMV69_11415 [Pirellulales bacterium]|nr:hypothetical protein [Pirellulales bacterium]
MSRKKEPNHHEGQHDHHQAHGKRPWWHQPHKHWWVYVAVALMLLAMVIYVMSFDERLGPGNPGGQPVPAAPGP